MKKLLTLTLLIITALPAFCEGTGTLIEWPEWWLMSTENIYLGYKHTSFPLTYLLDGNPATAWVFSGKGKTPAGGQSGYSLTLYRGEKKKPVTVDSLCIMNGYNKSRELFLGNNRITKIKLLVNGEVLKTVDLTDSMGWHKISIPRQKVTSLELDFIGFKKGRDDDICVSEIALYNRGKKIDMKMPKTVVYTPGSDCGDGQEYYVINHLGKQLAVENTEYTHLWSPNGQYVTGTNYGIGHNPMQLWIFDMLAGKLVKRVSIGSNDDWIESLKWKDNRTIILTISAASGPDKNKSQVKTIRLNGKHS